MIGWIDLTKFMNTHNDDDADNDDGDKSSDISH